MQTNLNQVLGVICVTGADSSKFLQGQLTNDITLLQDGEWQFATHLNHKGRMLASFIVYRVNANTYYLITTLEILPAILPRLKMFVLRAKVTLEIYNCNILLHDIQIASEHATHSIKIVPTHYISISTSTESMFPEDIDNWKQLLITNGIPFIYNATREVFIPQHVNYDLLSGISFTKGCYTGQEIVARTHYLGKVKRRMFHFTTNHTVEIGQAVISPTLNNQEVGIIVECQKTLKDNNETCYHGLVSLQSDCVETAYLDVANTQQLHLKKMNTIINKE